MKRDKELEKELKEMLKEEDFSIWKWIIWMGVIIILIFIAIKLRDIELMKHIKPKLNNSFVSACCSCIGK
jgi:hypothetical protein